MNRPRTAFLLALLLGFCVLSAVASDSLRTADSLKDSHAEFPMWSDSSLANSDSLAGGKKAVDRWYVPLGVIVLTGVSVWLLYSTRSK